MTRCGACGSDAIHELETDSFLAPGSVIRSVSFCSCEECGTVSHDDREFLPEDHYHRATYANSARVGALPCTLEFLERHVPALGGGLEILEVGCSTGDLMVALRERGSRVSGVEPSQSAREEAASRNLTVAPAREAVARGGFGLLVFCHVLEHVEEPTVLLSAYADLLDDGGFVYIEVPSIPRLAAGAESRFDNLYPHHRHHFTETGVVRMLERNDCSIVALDHHDEHAYPSVRALFRKEPPGPLGERVFTAHLRRERSRACRIAASLASWGASGRTVVVWGCGDEAYQIVRHLPDATDLQVVLVDVDPAKVGLSLDGRVIRGPEVLDGIRDPVVFIAPTSAVVADSIDDAVRRRFPNGRCRVLRNRRVAQEVP